MIEELLEKLELLVGTDDFEYDAEDIMADLEAEGAGAEIIPQLIGIMERHPLEHFGSPGAIVQFIERFYPSYLPELADSVRRSPALHTLWMLNRCINAGGENIRYTELLEKTANDPHVDMEIRDSARNYLEYRKNK